MVPSHLHVRHVVVLLAAAASIGSVACSIGEDRYDKVILPPVVRTQIKTCASPLVQPDKSALKECGDGKDKGHCFDKTKVPIPDDQLTACDGSDQACVPDSMLFADGKKLKACKFFLDGRPGACLSMLFKQVSDNKDLLQKDACDETERCAPCISPLDGSDTHLCDEGIGAHQDACVGGAGADVKACCHGSGACMTEDGVPADVRGQMSRETCPEKHLCAPASLTNGHPVTCSVLGFSGVCTDLCFAQMFQATTQVTRSSCGPTELCLPCALASAQGMTMPGCT